MKRRRKHKHSLIDRFWNKVEKTESCWIWHGARNSFGHGRFAVGRRWTGAHRFSWMLKNGPIPQGLQICHRCDNPPCVRVSHLFMGTQKDNIRDMDRKGRRVKGASPGERNGASKLRASDVKKMRFMRGTQKEIAAKFGVTDSLVRKILAGRLWKLSSAGWTGEGARFSRIGERHWKAKLEPSDVFRIRELSAEGASTRAISDQFGVGLNQVRCIVQRVSWRHL